MNQSIRKSRAKDPAPTELTGAGKSQLRQLNQGPDLARDLERKKKLKRTHASGKQLIHGEKTNHTTARLD
jgi:hypothetical protein